MPDLATFLQMGCLTTLAGVLVTAAWQDFRTLHIGNALSIAVAALFGVWAAAGLVEGAYSFKALGLSLACAGALFLVGAAAFAAGMLGGGDVKLLATIGLFAGPAQAADLLLVTAITGGLLGVAALVGAPLGPVSSRGAATLRGRLRGRLPYGPAIAVGGLWVATKLAIS